MPTREVIISVLVLEDDDDDLYTITRLIESMGISNYKLYNDTDIFMQAIHKDAHVCIIDHFLTKRTGLDILYQIKKMNESSFVIGFSGIKDVNTLIDYLNGDLDKFVDKNDPKATEKLQKYIMQGLEEVELRVRRKRAWEFFRPTNKPKDEPGTI